MTGGYQINLLDHGYLKFVESYGSDEGIIEAARMSTNKGFQGWGPKHSEKCQRNRDQFVCEIQSRYPQEEAPCLKDEECGQPGDEKLLYYLYSNKHATPFEMAGMIIEVQAPIMVFREWHRHRTQSYNELSARYTPLPDLNYIPTVERLMMSSKTNRQAGTVKRAEELSEDYAREFQFKLQVEYQKQQELYEWALNRGVPKELARVHLPVGRYSRMRASSNLRNWLAFLTLRMTEKAQWEIRQYANAVGSLIFELFPRTWKLFCEVK